MGILAQRPYIRAPCSKNAPTIIALAMPRAWHGPFFRRDTGLGAPLGIVLDRPNGLPNAPWRCSKQPAGLAMPHGHAPHIPRPRPPTAPLSWHAVDRGPRDAQGVPIASGEHAMDTQRVPGGRGMRCQPS